MGIVQTLVTVGGVLAIIGLLALLFCHYLGGWTWTKAWLRSSGEEKMVLTKAGTHRHFNPNGYMVSSDSDLNISGRGSFRRFDTCDYDYRLFRQGSGTSLRSQGNSNIPPQPLRPAPIPPNLATVGHLASQSSLDSVFNTAPSSPAIVGGSPVPKIPPPPSSHHSHHSGSGSSSASAHANQRNVIMGDGYNERGGGEQRPAPTSQENGLPPENTNTHTYSSTNPFLPLLQASSNFFTQTIQSLQTSQQEQPRNTNSAIATPVMTTTVSSVSSYYSNGASMSRTDSSSVSSTIPPNSAGLTMGELLFSAPPAYQCPSNPVDQTRVATQDLTKSGTLSPLPIVRASSSSMSSVTTSANSTSYSSTVPSSSGGALTYSTSSAIMSTTGTAQVESTSLASSSTKIEQESSSSVAESAHESLFSTAETSSSSVMQQATFSSAAEPLPGRSSPRLPSLPPSPRAMQRASGSPQHTRYGLYHQSSAENLAGSPSGQAAGLPPSPPPGGIRRASYPNRKEYMPHDSIPKSEFPQHIPYIPSSHYRHHLHQNSSGGAAGPSGERRPSGGDLMAGVPISDPVGRHHHHYLPSTGAAANVQPFLEEQEEPPEEASTNHQLTSEVTVQAAKKKEREDLTNRIILESMREEIRLANERMEDVTKKLMNDDVFLSGKGRLTNQTTTTSTVTTTTTAITTTIAATTAVTTTTTATVSSIPSSIPTTSLEGTSTSHYQSPRRRTFSIAGSLSSSLSGREGGDDSSAVTSTTTTTGSRDALSRLGDISALTLTRSSLMSHLGGGSMRRSSAPNTRFFAGRPTSLLGQRQRSNEDELFHAPQSSSAAFFVNSRETKTETEPTTSQFLYSTAPTTGSGSADQGRNGFGSGIGGGDVTYSYTPMTTTVTAALASSRFPSGSQPCTQSSGSEMQSAQSILSSTTVTASTSSSVTSSDHNGATGGTANFSSLLNNVTPIASSSTGLLASAVGFVSSSTRPPTVGAYFKQNSRSFSLRQSSTDSVGSDSDLNSPTDMPSLERAMSCDSVCSDTSVILGDLDPPHMTGNLCIGLEYDRETADLLVNVMEAKELVGPDPDPTAPFDSYVRVYLLPDKTTNMQTRVYRKSLCPVYREKFMFGLEMSELANRSLVFYLYATDKHTNTLIGEAELKLGDIDLSQNVVTWLLLTDTGQRGGEFGEIMFSLSYLPTAERLTVVVVKARNLKFPHERETGDPFVKVYLLQRGKKVSKKKSSTKRGEKNPIFNEAMIFSIPAHALQTIQLRITVADSLDTEGRAYSVGHVIVGSAATGKPLSHWNQMLSSLRKPIAMWHSLRR